MLEKKDGYNGDIARGLTKIITCDPELYLQNRKNELPWIHWRKLMWEAVEDAMANVAEAELRYKQNTQKHNWMTDEILV